MVYIREAHAVDSFLPKGGGVDPLIEDPTTLLERSEVARVCMSELALEGIPALVDTLDDEANQAYDAWPDRLALVGRDGRLAYYGDRGPVGFRPDELEEAIRTELE